MKAESAAVRPNPLKHGTLSLIEVVMVGLSQIAPAFSIMFTAGLIAAQIGSAVPVLYLVAMLGIGATGLTLAQFARIWPSSGSFVTYVSRSMGPSIGLGIAVIALLGYTIGNGGVYIYVGSYIATELLGTSGGTTVTLLATLGFAAFVTIPVIVGVRVGVRAAVLMYLFEAGVLLMFAVAVLVQGGDHGLTTEPFHSGFPDAKTFALSFALAILAFVGFEAPAPLGEETSKPHRNVPLAILLGVGITGLLYVVCSYALVVAFPDSAALGKEAAPFVTASDRFAGPLAGVVTWLFLTSVAGSFIGANTALARIVFSGAREGLWASRVAVVHRRFHTPWLAVLAVVTPSVGIGIASWAAFGMTNTTAVLPAFGILGIVLMFIATNVALVVKCVRDRRLGVTRPLLTWVVVPVLGVAVLGLAYWSAFQPGQDAPFSYLPWIFAAQIAAAALYVLFLRARRPDLVTRAGSIVMGEEQTAAPEVLV